MLRTRTLTLAATLALGIAVTACGGGTDRDPGSVATTSSTTPAGTSGGAAAPKRPFAIGDPTGLGDWRLTVTGVDIGPTTTVRFTLQNFTDAPLAVPGPGIFELHDGGGPAIGTPEVAGLPERLAGNGTAEATVRFSATSTPRVPYLVWTGRTPGSISAVWALTPEGLAPPEQ